MEQHPVPQNVTTFQFRLIGDMTIKQFGYLAAGAILAYVAYKLPLPFFITWPLAVTFALGGFGFAFVPIEERPMDVWVLSFIKNIYSPTQYVWQRIPALADPTGATAGMPAFPTLPNIIPLPKAMTQQSPAVQPPVPQPPQQPAAVPPVPVASPPPRQQPVPPAAAPIPPVPQAPVQHPQIPPIPVQQASVQPQGAPAATPPPAAYGQQYSQPTSAGIFAWIDNLFVSHPAPVQARQTAAAPASPPPVAVPPPRPQPAQPAPERVITLPTPQPVPQSAPVPKPVPVPPASAPSTPSWTPPVGPVPSIVGLKPDIPIAPPQSTAPSPAVSRQPGADPAVMKQQEQKMKQMEEQLAALQRELQQKTQLEEQYKQMQQQVSEAITQKRTLENEVVAMKKQSMTPAAPQSYKTAGVVQTATRPTVRVFTPDAAIRAGLPRLTSFPNVVTGIIKDFDNNLLPGVLVTVRDPEGVPVRALKTNKLGQFAASTPLPSGTYVVEVEDPRGRYLFDRVQFALTGAVMPAIEIVAKSKKELDRADLERKIFGQPV